MHVQRKERVASGPAVEITFETDEEFEDFRHELTSAHTHLNVVPGLTELREQLGGDDV